MNKTDSLRILVQNAASRAVHYLETLDDRAVGVSPAALRTMTRLGGTVPEAGESALDVLNLLDEAGSPATIASAGRRYFGYVIGGALPATVAASWLAAA